MRKFVLLIITFILYFLTVFAVQAEPAKVLSLNYDDTSSMIFLNIAQNSNEPQNDLKYFRLQNPNRIYFDIDNSVLIGEKQNLIFEKSTIKEVRMSQFTTNPDVVRTVITFDEDFDTSKVKLLRIDGKIIVKCTNLSLQNDYFNTIYNETPLNTAYSSIIVNSQVIKKVAIPNEIVTQNIAKMNGLNNTVMADIEKAFANSTLSNSDGKTYDSPVSIDLSSDLKLRTKYFINGYNTKNGGFLLSGLGQISTSKTFTLDNPKRVVIDLPNTFVDRNLRNKELKLCPDGSCKDIAKLGQFEFNKARLVVTTDNAEDYIPVFSSDGQSLLFIQAEKLVHSELANVIANLGKVYTRKIDNKTNEIILSFTNPIVHSIVRDNNALNLYFFNVKSYNEQEIIKTLQNSCFNQLTMSLLPQIGVRATIPIDKKDNVKIEQSVDGKAFKLIVSQGKIQEASNDSKTNETPANTAKNPIKGKVVLDAGHGGSDYGAIREGINEKDITMDVTQRVASILKSKGYKVALTRNDDTYVSLQDRVEFSENENPEIFVSIHVNSAVATEPKGIETHYYHEYSKELANVVHSSMMKKIDTKDRGLFKSKFYVINHTTVPAILVEMGFLSNEEERLELITDGRKQKTAKAIAEGIIEYIKSKK